MLTFEKYLEYLFKYFFLMSGKIITIIIHKKIHVLGTTPHYIFRLVFINCILIQGMRHHILKLDYMCIEDAIYKNTPFNILCKK